MTLKYDKFCSGYTNSFSGNADKTHGLCSHPLAREKYIENTNLQMIETGLLIQLDLPWAGFNRESDWCDVSRTTPCQNGSKL